MESIELPEHSGQGGRPAPAPSDGDLLERVSRGDREAFALLFDRYHPWVYQFARRRLGDAGAAEEAAGETFLAIWRNARRFRGESRPSTWIYGVAHYKCMATSRARRRFKRAALIPVEATVLASVADPVSLIETLEARESVRHLRRALRELPLAHRRILEMAFLENRPYGEIARRLGVREDTVKTRVARARVRLRRLFTPEPASAH